MRPSIGSSTSVRRPRSPAIASATAGEASVSVKIVVTRCSRGFALDGGDPGRRRLGVRAQPGDADLGQPVPLGQVAERGVAGDERRCAGSRSVRSGSRGRESPARCGADRRWPGTRRRAQGRPPRAGRPRRSRWSPSLVGSSQTCGSSSPSAPWSVVPRPPRARRCRAAGSRGTTVVVSKALLVPALVDGLVDRRLETLQIDDQVGGGERIRPAWGSAPDRAARRRAG